MAGDSRFLVNNWFDRASFGKNGGKQPPSRSVRHRIIVPSVSVNVVSHCPHGAGSVFKTHSKQIRTKWLSKQIAIPCPG